MYPQPADPVDRDIQGILAGVEPRQGGWHRFAIQEQGRQYPIKADTKRQETVQQAISLLGQPVAVNIREQEATPRPDGSHINPNNGQPWVNRYLNGIAPLGYAPGVQPTAGAPQPQQYQQPQQQPHPYPQTTPSPQPQQPPMQAIQPGLMGMDREISIMRQTAAKVIAMSVSVLPEDQRTPVGMIEACEVWMAYFLHGPLRFGVTAFGEQSEPIILHSQNGPAAYDTGSPRFVQLDGTTPCPECGHTERHAEGCPAGIPA